MARYIDATLLKAEFTGNFIDTSYSPEFIKAIIDGQPTADVQEVRHGRWILRGGWNRCSECDGKALLKDAGGTGGLHEYDQVRSNVCPYCGAKMK